MSLLFRLQAFAFDVEQESNCGWDALEVYDGETGALLGRFCGTEMPEVVASGTSLKVCRYLSCLEVVIVKITKKQSS